MREEHSVFFSDFSEYARMETFLVNNEINDNVIRIVKYNANITLQNIVSDMESQNLKEIAQLSAKIFNSVKSRKYEENLDGICMLISEVFLIAEIHKGDIKWIEEFGSKLKYEENSFSILRQNKIGILTERDINVQLSLKMSELKSILVNSSSGDTIKDICFYKNDRKLQAVIEMLLLDIMSILSRVGKKTGFFVKNQKNRFIWFKPGFFGLNRVFKNIISYCIQMHIC